MNRIVRGDILRFAAHYRGPKFHAVLCDPPYELGFMGRSWDSRGVSFSRDTWYAIRSLLYPGAHLLAFGGTRTFHRIAVAIEDAGFEIRDTIGWLYGSGFPKSHDVSKAIDREAGAEREITRDGVVKRDGYGDDWDTGSSAERPRRDNPATDAARAWNGYGTALKPAWEPVIVARNPLAGTVAANAQEYGCGALNLEASRIGNDKRINRPAANKPGGASLRMSLAGMPNDAVSRNAIGRFPANIIHDGSDEIVEIMGDAQRFFYCAKASKRERDEGLGEFEKRTRDDQSAWIRKCNVCGDTFCDPITSKPHCGHDNFSWVEPSPRANHHPTVKPLALTEYLARLILPASIVADRRILIPFAGSGSECIGAALAGWETVIGVERESEYAEIARARLAHWTTKRVAQESFA